MGKKQRNRERRNAIKESIQDPIVIDDPRSFFSWNRIHGNPIEITSSNLITYKIFENQDKIGMHKSTIYLFFPKDFKGDIIEYSTKISKLYNEQSKIISNIIPTKLKFNLKNIDNENNFVLTPIIKDHSLKCQSTPLKISENGGNIGARTYLVGPLTIIDPEILNNKTLYNKIKQTTFSRYIFPCTLDNHYFICNGNDTNSREARKILQELPNNFINYNNSSYKFLKNNQCFLSNNNGTDFVKCPKQQNNNSWNSIQTGVNILEIASFGLLASLFAVKYLKPKYPKSNVNYIKINQNNREAKI